MSRSGYSDDFDGEQWQHIMWRGAVASAIRGKRGRAFLQELADALDAMPVKRLIKEDLVVQEGEQCSVCAMGAVALARGTDVSGVDPYEPDHVARTMGIARALAMEVAWVNDEESEWRTRKHPDPDAARWEYVREWVQQQLDRVALHDKVMAMQQEPAPR